MKSVQVQGKTIPEAYHKALKALYEEGELSDCADWDTTQKELSMEIVVENPLAEPMISKCFIGGPEELEQYRQEMLDGILDFEIDRGNWEYTYHDRMTHYQIDRNIWANQVNFAIQTLVANPSSRRAIVLVRDNKTDMFNQDPACLQLLQFFIRNNKLDCIALFRSNDACKAAFMNMIALVWLQERIAKELHVGVGTYIHKANSFHCYEKDFKMLEGYYNRITGQNIDYLTYNYFNDWKELMEEFAQNKLPDKINQILCGDE